jgi:hypothetical protein
MRISIEIDYDCDYTDDEQPRLKALYKPGSTFNELPTLTLEQSEQAQQALISAVEDKILRRAEQIQMRGDIAREMQAEALREGVSQRGVEYEREQRLTALSLQGEQQ